MHSSCVLSYETCLGIETLMFPHGRFINTARELPSFMYALGVRKPPTSTRVQGTINKEVPVVIRRGREIIQPSLSGVYNIVDDLELAPTDLHDAANATRDCPRDCITRAQLAMASHVLDGSLRIKDPPPFA